MKSGHVTLSSIVQNYNLAELIAKKAFYELQNENIGKIHDVKGEIVLKRDSVVVKLQILGLTFSPIRLGLWSTS